MRGRALASLLAGAAVAGAAGTGVLAAEAPASTDPAACRVLHLADVRAHVLVHFPAIVAAEHDRTAARGSTLSAQGAFDISWRTRAAATPLGYYNQARLDSVLVQPTPLWGATFFGGYRLGRGDFAIYDGKLETARMGEVRAGVAVPLWRDGPIDRRRADLQNARLGERVAALGVHEQRLQVLRAAALRFWRWSGAGERLRVVRALLELALARDEAIREAVCLGRLPAIETTENARAILQRQSQVVAARRALQQSALELSVYLARPDGKPHVPRDDQLPVALPEAKRAPPGGERDAALVAEALLQRPELVRLRALREQAEVDARWANNQLAPAVDLQVVFSQDLGSGPKTLVRPELEVGVLVDIPLQRRVAQGRLRRAEARMARIAEETRWMRARIVAEVRDALSEIRAARERVRITRQERDAAQLLEEGERTRMRLGASNLFLVNLREQATADAAIRVVDALVDHHVARAVLRVALGSEDLDPAAPAAP